MDKQNPKAVLVTGCSSGIGLCAARTLQARGYRVLASCRKAEDVQRIQAEGLHCLQLDLDDSASIARAADQVLEETDGRLYGLFNNAGFGQPGAVEDLSRTALRAQFETNVFGGQELTNRLLPAMRRQGTGRIIQNSSLLGIVSLPYRGAYNASKYALEGLYDTLRLELAGSGVHVSLIQPGPIESRFRANAYQHFLNHIDTEPSAHRHIYAAMVRRLTKPGPAAPFTLPADAVVSKLLHALESPRPRARYYVTLPTYVFGYLKRVLSTRALDRILLRVSRGEQR